jgi:Bacteriophage HK97-gp10, putative tail-component
MAAARQQPVEMKIRGVRQLQAGARRLFENIEHAEAQDAVQPTAEQVAATVRSRVPKQSGRLAASVRASMRGQTGQVSMGAGLPYARWIEYGGGRGRPYRKSGRYVLPTARRTATAFRKHAQTICAKEIGRMHWPPPR